MAMRMHTRTLALLLLLQSWAVAETIVVDAEGGADFMEIQDAIDYAIDGDLILVEPGVYTTSGSAVIDPRGKAITIRANGDVDETVLQSSGEGRAIICSSGEGADTVIEGFLVRDFDAPWYDWNGNGNVEFWEYFGGALWCRDGSSPTIRACSFIGNSAEYGGAVYNGDENGFPANPMIIECVFVGNSAAPATGGVGGAIYNYSSSPEITGCTFEGNAAYSGGAILNWDGSNGPITECWFSDNTAHAGGGVYNESSMPTIFQSVFTGNTADEGAAIFNAEPGGSSNMPVIELCSIIGNSATGDGGGIHNFSISPQIIDCQISGNESGSGGGIYSWNASVPMLAGNIICANMPDQIAGSYAEKGANTIEETCPDDSGCFGDLNDDDQVDGGDLTIILGNWGDCPQGEECIPDLTGDGRVDGADITMLLAYWESC